MNRAASWASRVFRRLPGGLLGMLLLVAAGERWVTRHAHDLTYQELWDWAEASLAARQVAPHRQILCLGDSLLKVGALPQVFERETGKRTHNLAIFAGQAPSTYFLFRQALEAGARPAAVVVDFKPTILRLPPTQYLDRWPGLLTVRDGLDLAWTTRDASLFAVTMLGRHLPTVGNRFQIRKTILAALRGESTDCKRLVRTAIRNHRRNGGAQPQSKQPAPGGVHPVNLADPTLFPSQWACLPVHETYMRRFFDLAAERRIPVFWVVPPLAPATAAQHERLGVEAGYTRLIQTTQARYANVVVIDGRRSGYDDSVFIDSTHLDRDGALALSDEVARTINAALGQGLPAQRWVSLPPFRPNAVDVPVEDFQQSAVAIMAAQGRRR